VVAGRALNILCARQCGIEADILRDDGFIFDLLHCVSVHTPIYLVSVLSVAAILAVVHQALAVLVFPWVQKVIALLAES